MLKYAVKQWDANKDRLEEAIRNDAEVWRCDYGYLVKLIVRHILNGACVVPELFGWTWSEDVLEIDDGDYQGTLIFVIHRQTYQPDACEYLMTRVGYGSCSVCDVLQEIQIGIVSEDAIRESEVQDLMTLCKDIVTNFVHPFKTYYDEGFEETET